MAGRQRDIKGMVMSAVFILVGIIAYWDTLEMIDSDSYVFPRAIAVTMVVLCLAFIVWNLILPPRALTESLEAQTAQRGGSTVRRVALVVAMLVCALIMPYVGFYIAGLGVFFALLMIAMYDPWTKFKLAVYPIICIAFVSGFYFLFKSAFLVPLPEAPFL